MFDRLFACISFLANYVEKFNGPWFFEESFSLFFVNVLTVLMNGPPYLLIDKIRDRKTMMDEVCHLDSHQCTHRLT